MEALKEAIYTIENIYNLSEGKRAELIDGRIYYMAPPGTTHQKLVSRLNQKIANYIEMNGGNCEVFPAPFAVFLMEDDINYVEPDISIICEPSKIDEKGCHGAPDLVIEVVSESSRRMDYMIKLFKYRTAGVREYWIVDPKKQQTAVYNFERDMIDEYSFEKEIPVGIYENFSIRLQ